MVRQVQLVAHDLGHFPHTRGDGPTTWMIAAPSERFSPHPWGWSDGSPSAAYLRRIFPTPVGMVRIPVSTVFSGPHFPHTRGDGPQNCATVFITGKFSPHPWGWSAEHPGFRGPSVIFPTPVGMVRLRRERNGNSPDFPHTRGDGPSRTATCKAVTEFSPHPWG